MCIYITGDSNDRKWFGDSSYVKKDIRMCVLSGWYEEREIGNNNKTERGPCDSGISTSGLPVRIYSVAPERETTAFAAARSGARNRVGDLAFGGELQLQRAEPPDWWTVDRRIRRSGDLLAQTSGNVASLFPVFCI